MQWIEIHGFDSPGAFQSFTEDMEAAIQLEIVEELPVGEPYGSPNSSPYFKERWFRRIDDPAIWRLVAPELPFRGVFVEVEPG